MAYVLVDGVVTYRQDSDAVGSQRVQHLKEHLRQHRAIKAQAQINIDAVKAELAEIKLLDATIDTDELP